MTFDYSQLGDPLRFAENRLAAHSDHRWFGGPEEAADGVSRFERSLNGVWQFHYADNLDGIVQGFERVGFALRPAPCPPDPTTSSRSSRCDSWADILVPAHIQLQGYDRPHYTNIAYPWDGREAVEPGQVPISHNPVASYVTHFDWDEPLGAGERLSVVFHGAESAIAVWLNGEYVGYACDSFTPSEFDLTEIVVVGKNKLAAQVFKHCAASWIEDQDMFRFSGLFRDVVLLRKPACHAEDVCVRTVVADDLGSARVEVSVHLTAVGTVDAVLLGSSPAGEPPWGGASPECVVPPHDQAQPRIGGSPSWVGSSECVVPPRDQAQPRIGGSPSESGAGVLVVRGGVEVASPRLWSAEDPYLYDLQLSVRDQAGRLTEHIPLKVGVRRVGIEDGLIKINGQRLVFKGVNRHEFGADGRVMTRAQTEADIRALKAAGINAVRTSHYPNNRFFYELCDQYGLYVVDEMNLEAHGLWDWLKFGGRDISEAIPGDRPEWAPALLDRAASLLQRDKNHACVVMWSCGNESLGGTDILAVTRYFHDHDLRPVHYEGVHWDPRHPETTDVVSQMYTPAAEVESFLATHRDKPFIMCEYAHAMGNSCGAVDEYTELAWREPLYQGGFIWDFADQAVRRLDRYGQPYFAYGGDCDDTPTDYDFCGNGLFFADHTPSPKLLQVRHLYQDFQIEIRYGTNAQSSFHPSAVPGGPSVVGGDPSAVPGGPSVVGGDPSVVGTDPSACQAARSRSIHGGGSEVDPETSRRLAGDSRDVAGDSRDVAGDSREVAGDSRDVAGDSREDLHGVRGWTATSGGGSGGHDTLGGGTLTITNRHLFTDSSAYDCLVLLAREGVTLATAPVATAVPPGQTATYPLPFDSPDQPGEYTIDVSFRLSRDTAWAAAGHEVAWAQSVFEVVGAEGVRDGSSHPLMARVRTGRRWQAGRPGEAVQAGPPEVIEGIHNIGVRGPDFSALFSRTHPGLVSYRLGPTLDNSREFLRAIPKPSFWHAPTANERGWGMPYRDGQWLLASRYATTPEPPTLTRHQDSAEITYHYQLPTTPPSACDVSYRVHTTGLVEVEMTVSPAETLPDMPECGMLFICDADLRHLEWYGEGPEECYVDRRSGARLGVHRAEVAQQLTPYLRPQEAGSHTQVRWAMVTDDSGQGLRFAATTPMEFSALPWTPFEIENAAHAHELPPIHHTVLRPALARRGVGGDNSWGAMTHPEYCLPASPLTFRFSFQGVPADSPRSNAGG